MSTWFIPHTNYYSVQPWQEVMSSLRGLGTLHSCSPCGTAVARCRLWSRQGVTWCGDRWVHAQAKYNTSWYRQHPMSYTPHQRPNGDCSSPYMHLHLFMQQQRTFFCTSSDWVWRCGAEFLGRFSILFPIQFEAKCCVEKSFTIIDLTGAAVNTSCYQ